jgi:hypothetical protein
MLSQLRVEVKRKAVERLIWFHFGNHVPAAEVILKVWDDSVRLVAFSHPILSAKVAEKDGAPALGQERVQWECPFSIARASKATP